MSWPFLLVAGLLLIGVVLRQCCRPLRSFYIPASVVAGFVGLALINAVWFVDTPGARHWVQETNGVLSSWPGPLIAVVFAAMMLQAPAGGAHAHDESTARRVGREGLMVWIIVLGQTFVGLLATWLLIQPGNEVPNSFGMLIETGFAGGHGTAAAMGQVFSSEQINFAPGLDLGMLMATCGLVYGVVSGILWINLGARLGWLSHATTRSDAANDSGGLADASGPTEQSVSASEPEVSTQAAERKPIGFETLTSEAIDPLLLQVIWIAVAVAIGAALQWWVLGFAGWLDGWLGAAGGVKEGAEAELSKRMSASSVMDFPLFIYTMFGGWLVRFGLRGIGQEHRVDAATVQRISSTAMEVLVVAAITSLKLSAVAALIGPFSILFVAGAIWTAICLLVISRWVLPRQHWFELGLINYGMSTGTTATGFVLLRLVDPELKTAAASDYALAAPISAPFVGGGILTIGLPLILLERVSIVWPIVVIGVLVSSLVAIGKWSNRGR
jgi:ESS family glutamate:Na+ symporter